MESATREDLSPPFLAGGGELGALIRRYDWRSTPLGPPGEWPHGLRTAVRIMLTSMQPIWIGWGDELTYLYNDPYKAIIGGKHPRMLGQPTKVVWREIWDTIEPMLDQALGGDRGTYVESQLLIMERNGYPEETYYTFSYSPIPDDSGRPAGIICANTDDTQRVIGARQLALLRELAARPIGATSWREACSLSAEAIATDGWDLPFCLLFVDEGQGEWTLAGASGFGAGDAPTAAAAATPRAWPLGEAAPGQRWVVVEDLQARFGETLPCGAWPAPPSRAAVVAPAAALSSGLELRLVVGLSPFRALDEDYGGFLALVAGQVAASMERAHAFEQEQRRVEALAALDRAKTAFFSNVSHEFRTPLTLMLGPIEELLERSHTDLSPAAREQLEIASRNGGRLLRLVNNLLDFSRIEAGRVRAVYEPVDLARYTAELASIFRTATERAGLDLIIDCPPLPEPVYVDRDMWEKVVLNLVSNAFKFTFEGSVAVRLDAHEGQVRLRVSDTGCGVAAEDLPRLFERFHRVESARARTHEGSGIGLALVQELVKLHGGTITAESTPGQGTTFTVMVPFGHAHLPPAQVVTAGEAPRPGAGGSFLDEALGWLPGAEAGLPAGVGETPDSHGEPASSGPEGAPLVLVAEDNADMRAYVGRLLRERYRVKSAANGEDALRAAREEPPDLILSDVMMPGMDGFALLRAIREDPALRELPVVLLSARAGEEATVEGLAHGADDYLVKPFGARELLARLGSHLQLAQVRKQAGEAIREREARLAEDLSDARLLQSLSDQLIAEEDVEALYERLVDAARQIMRADYASMQGYESSGDGGLWLLAHRGFDAEAAAGWAWIDADDETTCGLALRADRRVVIADVASYAFSPGSSAREEYLRAGIQAVQSTPLRSRTGALLGMLSTHWREPHAPEARELLFMDILARQAADLLERNRNLEQLRAGQLEFETLLDSAPIGVYLVDADWRVVEANPVALPTFGDVPGGPVGGDFQTLLRAVWPTEYADEVTAILRHTLETGEPYLMPEKAERRLDTGEVEYYEWRVERITLPDTRFGVVCYFKDISAQVAVREAIAASEERARAASQFKDQLLGMVSHEFRSPLTTIIGNISALDRLCELPAETREAMIADLNRESRRLRRLVENMLLVAQRDSQAPPPELDPISLGPFLRTAAAAFQQQDLSRPLVVDVEPGVPPVLGNAGYVEQVVENLAANSRKYGRPGTPIRVRATRADGEVRVAVTDEGERLDQDAVDRYFEPFFRDERSAAKAGGTGLGLAVCSHLVELMGGTIAAHARPEGGLEVSFTLPALDAGPAGE